MAMQRATEQVVDRYGGTHLASCLAGLLASRHGNALRGGVLVVASDGWDSDDPAMLVRSSPGSGCGRTGSSGSTRGRRRRGSLEPPTLASAIAQLAPGGIWDPYR